MNCREARTGSASERFGRNVRARNAQSTFDKPLACVTGIFDHAFGKPLAWIADKFTFTFDPLLTASKGISKEHLWYAIPRRSQVSKNGLCRLWSGWQRRIRRWSLMRVKSHQIRAKVAFTKPLTTHLMRCKGDFSCRAYGHTPLPNAGHLNTVSFKVELSRAFRWIEQNIQTQNKLQIKKSKFKFL